GRNRGSVPKKYRPPHSKSMKGGCSPQNSLHLREAGSVWQTFFFESAKYFWEIGLSLQNPQLAFKKKPPPRTHSRRGGGALMISATRYWRAGRPDAPWRSPPAARRLSEIPACSRAVH